MPGGAALIFSLIYPPESELLLFLGYWKMHLIGAVADTCAEYFYSLPFNPPIACPGGIADGERGPPWHAPVIFTHSLRTFQDTYHDPSHGQVIAML